MNAVAMPEKNRLQNAINLIIEGRRKEAVAELLALEKVITDKNLRIQLIDTMLSALDPVKENAKLIELSDEAITITDNKNLQAFFMSRKADFLMGKITFLLYDRTNLKLSPGWIEFSIEADKREYEALTMEIEK